MGQLLAKKLFPAPSLAEPEKPQVGTHEELRRDDSEVVNTEDGAPDFLWSFLGLLPLFVDSHERSAFCQSLSRTQST